MTSNPDFQVTTIFDAKYASNGTRYMHRPYPRPTHRRNFE